MVVLAVALLSKTGKVLVSRQFVDMSRVRIDGLLSAFPKLMGTGKQHTYVETESVRYVYQPMENIYITLITNKNSNIVEDLDTLRLIARIVPDQCKSLEEDEITEKAFELMFAFDEVISLGYRENLTIDTVRTFLEMNSHEEALHEMIKKSKMDDVKAHARQKAKQIAEDRQLNRLPRGGISSDSSSGAMGGSSTGGGMPAAIVDTRSPSASAYGGSSGRVTSLSSSSPAPSTESPSAARGPSKGMKLGKAGSSKASDALVQQMISEGEMTAELESPASTPATSASTTVASLSAPSSVSFTMENVHVKTEETISATVTRDGALQSMELKGDLVLTITDPNSAYVRVLLKKSSENKSLNLKTHPQINKDMFSRDSILACKDPSKPFPVGTATQIVRWSLAKADESLLPISVNCWPTPSSGGMTVSLEYELQRDDLTLNNLALSIPLPTGEEPRVETVEEGRIRHDSRNQTLQWVIDSVGESNRASSLEFFVDGASDPNAFFPINIVFSSSNMLSGVEVFDVISSQSGNQVKYSKESSLIVQQYSVV